MEHIEEKGIGCVINYYSPWRLFFRGKNLSNKKGYILSTPTPRHDYTVPNNQGLELT